MKFISRFTNHVLVVKPTRKIDDGENIVIKPGKRIEFRDGVYETADPDEVKFLRKHPDFGLFIFEDRPVAPQMVKAAGS